MKIQVDIRRAYDQAGKNEGYRVLVDRLWPRGVSKEELHYEAWCKDIAPSPELRKWFAHKAQNWEQFRKEYQEELRRKEQKERLHDLIEQAGTRHITLLYGARDAQHNHAIVLADELSRVARSVRSTGKNKSRSAKSG